MFLSILKDSYLNFARKIIKVLKNKLLNEKKWFSFFTWFGVFPFDDMNIAFQYFNLAHYNIILLFSVSCLVFYP